MSNNTDYEIGYGKPPKASQFTKGQSGNPAGRKKGARSHSELIAAAMRETVTVNLGGRRKTITKLEAALTQQANKAAGGDRHAIKLMMELLNQSETRDEARQAGSPMSAQERKASDNLILETLRAQAMTLAPLPEVGSGPGPGSELEVANDGGL